MTRTAPRIRSSCCTRPARAVAAGAEIVEEPVDQPYGVREYGARDLEGHLWYFHSPLG
jgi:uncharacterized glyoxalase superfamily protein PhnB